MTEELVLVTGGTGQVARQVVAGLRPAGARVRVLTRDERRARELLGDEVEIVTGEWTAPGVLERAVDRVDRVFLAVGTVPHQDALENLVVDAAAAAGRPHVVKLSTIGADLPAHRLTGYQVARWHAAVEERLRSSGLPTTVLRPNAFLSNLLALAPTVATQHALYASTGPGRVSMTDPRDVADVAVALLTGPVCAGESYLLTGPDAVSYPDVAELLTQVTGHEVAYVEVDDDAVRAGLAAAGLPGWLVEVYVEGNVWIRSSAFAEIGPDVVQQFTGRPRRGPRAWLTENAAAFAPA